NRQVDRETRRQGESIFGSSPCLPLSMSPCLLMLLIRFSVYVMLVAPMSSASPNKRRVVITGLGLISPLGNTPAALWSALMAGKSGVGTTSIMPADRQP